METGFPHKVGHYKYFCMIGIADSGSTKTEWCFLNEAGEEKRVTTRGLNPFMVDNQQIRDCLEKDLYPFINNGKVKYLFFYGSGCANNEKRLGLYSELEDFFPHADISIESDLLGAALALCGPQAGMIGILGTGSATAYFDGEGLHMKVPSLGFVLGDEGSGARIGIHFLADYLRGGMPEELRKEFAPLCPLPLHEIIDTVYHGQDTGRFLGELGGFSAGRYENPYVKSVLFEEFDRFFQKQVLPYGELIPDRTIHLSGSTAFYAQEILREAARKNGLETGNILQNPMEGLVRYFKPQIGKLLQKTIEDPEIV